MNNMFGWMVQLVIMISIHSVIAFTGLIINYTLTKFKKSNDVNE